MMKGRQREALHREPTTRRAQRTNGITLIELLVVITVLLLLTAVSVPMMKPALESGRIREAGRQVNAYFAMARARASQIGRPAGVWIERSEPGSNAAFELFLAEVPEAYSGDGVGALATVTESTTTQFLYSVTFTNSDVFDKTRVLVEANDVFLIRFDYRGPRFRCRRVPTAGNTPPTDQFLIDGRPQFMGGDGKQVSVAGPAPGTAGRPVPFQIFRSPRKALGRPMQLGGGTIVDLEFSGMGMDFSATYPRIGQASAYPSTTVRAPGIEFAALNQPSNIDDKPIVIMFEPGGSVQSVSVGGEPFLYPTGSIHLLIGTIEGQVERAESTTVEPNPVEWSASDTTVVMFSKNLSDRGNLWLSISHRNGSVTTSPNGWEPIPDPLISPPLLLDSLRYSREYAQEGDSLGGQ